ncbi:Putative N-acetyl-LL-diaminopimelate aminotransferase [Anaerohalosphaera lusitana]|uniref:Aminotransferase n=1 Tax=Anaerohalosphaera lusitana TaxID=1936003 RepID=A0A1U9NMU7_9BACT|nr:aminotransferase class I/II-fold pyridoxal phosphate-dependent enzyme [Anaerohalosphaera lusitana]AQT69155.1 Putative N-acetyl-LL-diaminopimelate aminotransferase [Anaerohalosphaera lusitana]
MDMQNVLADRTAAIDASGIRKVFALAASLKDPINLSIGLPDFDVPEPIKERAIKAVQDGANRYSQTNGDAELLTKLQGLVKEDYGWNDPEVLVTSGVSGALQLIFMSLINPGDEVIVPDPYFVIYKHMINMLGGKCVFVDTYPDFKLPAQKVADAITPKTKLIILNSPSNPTGTVYSDEDLRGIAEVAEKNGTIVMSDEIYDAFCYDEPCPSIANHYDKTILVKGFSKAYAMTGWRLGYAAVKPVLKPVLEEMIKIQQYTFVCAPTPFQKAAITAIDTDISGYVADYKVKRDLVYEGLKDDFELVKSGGAFYTFVKAPDSYDSATAFVEKAIENNVLIIPGNVFSEKDTHFRISYATTNDKIKQGLDILRSLAK